MFQLNQQAVNAVQQGLQQFSRLTALRNDPREVKWIQDELDVIFTLDIVKLKMIETLPMMGKVKHKDTKQFDFIRDVKEEVEEFLLTGRESRDTLLQQKRHLMMYHLVIEPVIDMFQGMTHQYAVINANEIIDSVIDMINQNDVVTSYDDALATREIVRKEVQEREAARKALKTRRKRIKQEVIKIDELKELEFDSNNIDG